MSKPNILERFMNNIDPNPTPQGCLLWRGSKTDTGYGIFWMNGRHERAHRYCYQLSKGYIPYETYVRHSCGNRDCVNPDHLYIQKLYD